MIYTCRYTLAIFSTTHSTICWGVKFHLSVLIDIGQKQELHSV